MSLVNNDNYFAKQQDSKNKSHYVYMYNDSRLSRESLWNQKQLL